MWFPLHGGCPVEEEIGRYYETPEYISHSNTHKGLTNLLYHGVRRFMLGRKAGWCAVSPTARQVVCST